MSVKVMTLYSTLIVDDEKWVRTALRCTIEESGLPVWIAKECGDGEDALGWLAANQVDLVLADIRMPRLDGLSLVRKLRALGSEQDVVLITVHDDFRFIQEALRLGVVDYLVKPVQTEDIAACFEKWLKRRPAADAASAARPEVIDQVINFIETEPLATVNLTEAARRVHLTPSYLSHLFKQHMNGTFIEYVTAMRMREAKKLLRKTNLTIAEIAGRLAYADVAYFSNCFKKETGISPSEYRRDKLGAAISHNPAGKDGMQ
jgi:YesN/AraC family two-component response regulator